MARYMFITKNEEKAVNAVRNGMTRSQAAKDFKVPPVVLNTLCRSQGIEPKLGRPRKVKK